MSYTINTITPNFVAYSDSPLPLTPTAFYSDNVMVDLLPAAPFYNSIVKPSTFYNPVVGSSINVLPSSTFYTPIVDSYGLSPVGVLPMTPVGATVLIPGTGSLPSFLDLNKDSEVQKRVTNYFRYKTLDKWLYNDMADVLDHFKVHGNDVKLTERVEEHKTDQDIEKIIDYIEKYILTENTMRRILSNFIENTNSNWYDLHKNEYFIEDGIHKKLLSIIKHTIQDTKK